jgi:membrane-associated phospholipid phosphatase
MPAWTGVSLAFSVYLAIVAWLVPRFAAARLAASLTLGLFLALWWWWPVEEPDTPAAAVSWVIVPSLALLLTYRMSGAFFVRTSQRLERRLLALDDALLARTGVLHAYRAAPTAVRETVELFYLLVYAVVPAGATVLVLGDRADALGSYWTTVFVAELACYAALPWLQSRPPRALERGGATGASTRNLNLWLLRHGSIQGNTFPSAHAAGAVAIALAVWSAIPAAGAVLMLVAVGITLATVLGRYHYALDSILGVAVALASWFLSTSGAAAWRAGC